MRINNNLMAMNTHRQLGINSENGAKSIEKLSSGYRINRAGDDAAGLAISEKMRSQVRGLTQASRNSQDGISLIQTAEGALNETQAILQRMRELAVQSANDTNVDADRSQIQKEMDQLTSEINRISNTTEFNTQKLLKGAAADGVFGAVSTTNSSQASGTAVVDTFTQNAGSTVSAAETWIATVANASLADTNVQTFTFNGATVTLTADDLGNAAVTSATSDTAATILLDKDSTAAQIAAELQSAFEAMRDFADGDLTDNALYGFSFDGTTADFTITDAVANGATNTALTITTAGADVGAITIDGATAAVASEGTGVDEVLGSYSVTISTNFTAGDTIDIDGTTFTAVAATATAGVNEFNVGADATATAANLVTAYNTLGPAGNTTGDLTASSAAGVLTFTEQTGTAGGADLVAGDFTVVQATEQVGDYSFTLTSNVSAGEVVTIGSITLTEGTDFTLGADTAATAAAIATAFDTADAAATDRFAAAVVAGSTITITENVGSATGVDLLDADVEITPAGGTDFSANLQIGANYNQSFNVAIGDMRAAALGVSTDDITVDPVATDGSTGAAWVTTASITNDGSVATEYSLDISDHTKATAAISVINDAIESVSTQRASLGAAQNRLEHTIKNLDTSAENLQASESRIRDVDMAKEMMEFTKNNILQQAAQAMLAQANQAPQGVLQLLR